MLLKFTYYDKPVYINPQYVTAVLSHMYDRQVTLIYVVNKADCIVVEEDTDDVANQIQEAMQPLFFIKPPEDK